MTTQAYARTETLNQKKKKENLKNLSSVDLNEFQGSLLW